MSIFDRGRFSESDGTGASRATQLSIDPITLKLRRDEFNSAQS